MINTWKDIVDFKEIEPLIQENWRETIGVNTCDKRSPKSVIAKKYEDPLGLNLNPDLRKKIFTGHQVLEKQLQNRHLDNIKVLNRF